MKNIDLPLEIRTKKKNECIDIREIEHEGGGGDMKRKGEKKWVKEGEMEKKVRDEEKERWPL